MKKYLVSFLDQKAVSKTINQIIDSHEIEAVFENEAIETASIMFHYDHPSYDPNLSEYPVDSSNIPGGD
jgi:hypothetical protein